jgi:hypothetical protein
MESSSDALLFKKLSQLPESLKSEAMDFIDFLLTKKKKPSKTNKPKRAYGSMKGLIAMSPDFDAPLEDFKDYM